MDGSTSERSSAGMRGLVVDLARASRNGTSRPHHRPRGYGRDTRLPRAVAGSVERQGRATISAFSLRIELVAQIALVCQDGRKHSNDVWLVVDDEHARPVRCGCCHVHASTGFDWLAAKASVLSKGRTTGDTGGDVTHPFRSEGRCRSFHITRRAILWHECAQRCVSMRSERDASELPRSRHLEHLHPSSVRISLRNMGTPLASGRVERLRCKDAPGASAQLQQ